MRRQRQSGVALVMVLLILAVAVAVCMALISSQQRQIQSQVQQRAHRQAWQLALEGEALALAALSATRYPGQSTAGLPRSVQQGPMRLDIQLDDLSGRLNLNALVSAPGQVDAAGLARLQRLLQLLDLPAELAWGVVARLDPAALSARMQGPPHLSGSGPLADVSELRALPGVDASAYARLQPHVSALPVAIGLNVNQASALVLASLADGLGAGGGRQLLQARPATGYRSVDAFVAQPLLARYRVAADGLQVAGQAFEIHSRVHWADGALQLSSIVVHDAGRLRVCSRQLRPLMATEETR